MKKEMSRLTIIFLILFVISFVVYFVTHKDLWVSLSITFGVTSYHFVMRLIVGFILDRTLCNSVNYKRKWFFVGSIELKIYKMLGVRKWKKFVPTYKPEYFDIKSHDFEEIIGAMCQAEIVHETIVLFSFAPILLTIWFNSFWVFLITSIISALIDTIFVILQRYNRPRVLRLFKSKI